MSLSRNRNNSQYTLFIAAKTPSLLYLDPEAELQGRHEVEGLPAGDDEGGGETLGGDQRHHHH